VRAVVLDHCLREDGRRALVHGAVVMPDHVHLILTPLPGPDGRSYGLPEILQGIKGSSARAASRALGRKGPLWQTESFDHVLRSDENLRAKVHYIAMNPARKGLARRPDDYPWLWREYVEGDRDV
jgi:putative DNA methylase